MPNFFNKYPYTDFHELNLDWVLETVKRIAAEWAETLEEWHNTQEEWQQLYDYVHDYFDNLDVQQEINYKLDVMATDGTLAALAQPFIDAKVAQLLPAEVALQIDDVVSDQIDGVVSQQIGSSVASQLGSVAGPIISDWLDDHITQPTTPAVDTSLTVAGAAADAKVVGDKFNLINDARNLCFSAVYHPNRRYSTSDASDANFSYFELSVVANTTYYFVGNTRWLTTYDGSAVIVEQLKYGLFSYTPTYTGTLYWTINNDTNYAVCTSFGNPLEVAPFYLGKNVTYRLDKVDKGNLAIDSRNLLTNAKIYKGYYYNNGNFTANTGYDVYVFNVENGVTYQISPGARFICKISGSSLMPSTTTPFTYTSDFDGPLFVTIWNEGYTDYKVYDNTEVNVIPIDAVRCSYLGLGQSITAKFVGASVLNIGDSIAENRVDSTNYATQFCNATGANLSRDVAYGGATLSLTANQGTRRSIYKMMQDTVDTYPTAGYDIIMVDGGTNDYGLNRVIGSPVKTGDEYLQADYEATFDVTTVCGALEKIFQLARTYYTGATIIFVIPHKNLRTNTYYYQILDAIREVCYKWSVTVVDMDKDGELNSRIAGMRVDYTDIGGTHQNTLGNKVFYLPRIIEALIRSYNN